MLHSQKRRFLDPVPITKILHKPNGVPNKLIVNNQGQVRLKLLLGKGLSYLDSIFILKKLRLYYICVCNRRNAFRFISYKKLSYFRKLYIFEI